MFCTIYTKIFQHICRDHRICVTKKSARKPFICSAVLNFFVYADLYNIERHNLALPYPLPLSGKGAGRVGAQDLQSAPSSSARFCDEATGTGEKEKENRAKRLAFRGRYVVDIHFKQLRCTFTITLYWPAKQFIPKAGERQLPLQKADRREL